MNNFRVVTRNDNNLSKACQKGFTLIEVMIVVVIIGILAAIAIPMYHDYVIETRRTDMMGDLQGIGSEIESQKISQGSYSKINLARVFTVPLNANGEAKYPDSTNPLYTVTIQPISKAPLALTGGNWKLTATPETSNMMADDGLLTLDFQGVKCHGSNCSSGEDWQNN